MSWAIRPPPSFATTETLPPRLGFTPPSTARRYDPREIASTRFRIPFGNPGKGPLRRRTADAAAILQAAPQSIASSCCRAARLGRAGRVVSCASMSAARTALLSLLVAACAAYGSGTAPALDPFGVYLSVLEAHRSNGVVQPRHGDGTPKVQGEAPTFHSAALADRCWREGACVVGPGGASAPFRRTRRNEGVLSPSELADQLNDGSCSDNCDYTLDTVKCQVGPGRRVEQGEVWNGMFAFYDPRDMECTQAFAALAPHLGTAWFFAFNESKIPDSITETLRTRLSNVSHLVFDGPFQWDSCFSACEAATAGGNMTLRDLRITSNPLPMEVTDGMRAYLGLLPVGLEILYLTDDGITTLADGVFDRFVHLEVLHLDGNSIQSIPEGFFTKVPLQDLSLSGNNLSQFSLQGLDALQTLDVSNNLLSAMPSLNYASLPRLLELRIDSNSIERLPNDAFADASQLKILVLAGNGLAEIPAGLFDGNPLLGLVDLSRNALVSLPSGVFRNNPNLSGVNVGYNRITMLPDDLFSSGSNLLGLLLNDNQLAALPPHMIQGQRDLIGIGFENNRISELPEGYFDDCRQLTSLDMADNQISRLPKDAFAHNGMLTFLSMGSNKLSGMQQGSLFGQQSQLMSLNISYNHMLSLPDRPDWTGMSLIDVSGTSIQVHWRMCENAATVVLRGMTNMSLSSLESVVEACIGKATILDISDNDRVLNNISFVEHLLSGFSMPVRVAADDIITGTTTIIQMESSPTQCSLRRSMARRLLPRSLAGDVPHRLYAELPALMYTCECSEAYYRSGDGVCMSVPYWTGARAALLVLGLTIGVAGVVVYFVRLAQRRRRLFKADLELHQGLLQETQ